MGPGDDERQRLLEEARTAHREYRYDAAYWVLRSADEGEPLAPDDQQLLADSAWWLGLLQECLRLTEQLHRRYLEAGNVDRAAAQALDLGGMLAMRGEYALASGWLSRARRLLADRSDGFAHGVLAYVDLSQAIEEGRLDEARGGAERLHRLGERLGEDTLSALGRLGMGLVEVRRGHLADGFALLDEAMLPVVAGTVAPEWAGHVYCTITATCLDVADLTRAREWFDAANRWLEGFPDAVMFNGVCRAHRVHLLSVEGAWREAEAEAEKVVEELRELNTRAVAEAEYCRAEVYRVSGRYDEAAAAYARTEALGREPQPGEALLRMARGDWEGSWTAVTDVVSRSSGDPFQCVRLLRAQVAIGAVTGHLESAAGAAQRLREVADRFQTPGFLAWADDAEGQVHLANGDNDLAVAALYRAAEGYRSLKSWYDLAVAEAALAVACERRGADEVARIHHDAADAGFRRLQVPPPATVAPPPTHPGGLTTRETEVLAVVARGVSNKDAASALSVSEATVRRHLANIYLKLGVGSRTAAAAWAHEHGLVSRARA